MRKPFERPRELICCPNCGIDLRPLRVRQIGELWADPRGDTYWRGRPVKLNQSERMVLHTLLTLGDNDQSSRQETHGWYASRTIIAERAGIEENSVDVIVSFVRKAFKAVDPTWEHIESGWGVGYRWKREQVVQMLIKRRAHPPMAVFSDNSVEWRNKYTVYLSEFEARTLAFFIKAEREGRFAVTPLEATNSFPYARNDTPSQRADQRGRAMITHIQKKFKKADPDGPPVIELIGRGKGYRLYTGSR